LIGSALVFLFYCGRCLSRCVSLVALEHTYTHLTLMVMFDYIWERKRLTESEKKGDVYWEANAQQKSILEFSFPFRDWLLEFNFLYGREGGIRRSYT